MAMSRRVFMRLTGIAGVGVLVNAGPTMNGAQSVAWAADEYDLLRQRVVDAVTGTGYDPTSEPFASKLAQTGASAAQFRSTMATGSALWPDLPIGTSSANIVRSFDRLQTMARAYRSPGTGLTGDATLAAEIGTGLDWMVANAYRASGGYYDNWFHWQISGPQSLLRTAALVFETLSAQQVASYVASVDHHSPGPGTSTGANRVNLCYVLVLRGIVGKHAMSLADGRDGLSPVFAYVTAGDGFYADGSFIQHTWVPYTGTYGGDLLAGLAQMFALLAGSTWQVDDPSRQVVFDAVEKVYAPFLYNGLMMDGQSGRMIARGIQAADPDQLQEDDHRRGQLIISSILLLADGAPATQRARWRGLAKGWLQRAYWSPFLSNPALAIPRLALGKDVLDDATVAPIAEPAGHQVFGGMDRAVHRRPGWALALAMSSARTTFYETGNGENLRGWHTNNGLTYWWGDTVGNGQYSDAFWPTVDPYRLPGTTVSRKVLADGAGGTWGASRPPNNWAGGATDGEFGSVGQYTHGLQSTLKAKKSWFCLADSVVCLGTVRCSDAAPAESTVDNRNLGGGAGTHLLTVDGVAQPTGAGWSVSLDGIGWAHLQPFGGYVFPGGADVRATREQRTGRWRDLDIEASTTPITRTYLTLWFDHGVDPHDDEYVYLLMPGATAGQTAARAADTGWLTVLANTWTQQAIAVASLGVTAVNFWHAGAVAGLAVDQPASVLVRESGGTATISVADPLQSGAQVRLTWDRAVTGVVSADPTVTVEQTGTQLVLRVAVDGSAGASHQATVTRG